MPLAPAFRLGPYEIVELLSVGGMGEVYRARDTRLGRYVAIKVLPRAFAADRERLSRFEHEAQAAGALNHPNIVAVHDVGSDDGLAFVVSELIEGVTLRDKLARGLPRRVVLDYTSQIARGLTAAHAAGIVHRDLKPENVMALPDGRVKIVDFGIAKRDARSEGPGSPAETAQQTLPGVLVGTVDYMSPEQVRGETVDHRTDIFSLGVILYEALTGRHPFRHATAAETMSAILRDSPPAAEGIEGELDWVLRHALEKDREARFQSALDVALALESVAQGRQAPQPAAVRGERAALSSRAIAVLPFTNLASDSENEYFSDGLTEELIQALTRVPGLQVVAWHSAVQLKGRERDAQSVGRNLNASTVLTGTVRRAGDRVRIGARLVEVATGFILWSETYDRQIEDVFAIQEEIARAIVQTLPRALADVRLQGLPAPGRTASVEVYNLYLKGRFFWNKRTAEGLRRSVECFESALALDEHFALAHAGLADACCLLTDYGVVHPGEVMPRARAAAIRALELDPRSAEAHASFAYIRSLYDWEWLEGEALYRRAIELGPGYATAHHWFAIDFLAMRGRFDEAAEHVETARQLDPLSMIIQEGRGYLLMLARRYDEAIAEYQSLFDLDPQFVRTYTSIGRAYLQKGLYREAATMLEKGRTMAGDVPNILGALGQARGMNGEREEARRLLQVLTEMSTRRYVPATCFALIHAGLGEGDAAVEWLDRGSAQHELPVVAINVHPAYDPLRSHPRFASLLRRMRFVD